MLSLRQKLTQLQGLVGTSALNDWETRFVQDISTKIAGSHKAGTTVLTENQVEKIDELWERRCK